MEFLSSPISRHPQFPPAIPFPTFKIKETPSRLRIPCSRRSPLRPSFSLYPFRSTKSQISARYGRPTNRQNYLRKKLTQQQHQQQVSHTQHPVLKFDGVDNRRSDSVNSGEIFDKGDENLENEPKFDGVSEGGLSLDSSSLGVCLNASETVNESETGLSCLNASESVNESEIGLKEKKFGESMMWNKLENWVEQYKKDSEFWGIGAGPIFTVFQNSEGGVERVVVNEDEIMRRNRVNLKLDKETEGLAEVNHKISFAKNLAREMETGITMIPKHSSVAKFLQSGKESRFMEMVRGVTLKPISFPRMSRVGFFVLCGLCIVWAIRGIFPVGEKGMKYTSLEKEMLRRKMKARTEKEKMVKGSVEIMEAPIRPKSDSLKRPQLDKEELVSSIVKAKGSISELGIGEYDVYPNNEYKDKIEEIREMARHARETERSNNEPGIASKDLSKYNLSPDDRDFDEAIQSKYSTNGEDLSKYSLSPDDRDFDEAIESKSSTNEDMDEEKIATGIFNVPDITEMLRPDPKSSDLNEANEGYDGLGFQSAPSGSSSRKKLRIIKSATEAREYLSSKHLNKEMDQKHGEVSEANDPAHLNGIHDFGDSSEGNSIGGQREEQNIGNLDDLKKSRISSNEEDSVVSNNDAGISAFEIPGEEEIDSGTTQNCNSENEVSFPGAMPDSEDTESSAMLGGNKKDDEVKDKTAGLAPSVNNEKWLEKNFHEFEPIIEKMGIGFRNNYWVARETASQDIDLKTELKTESGDNELEWMKDEKLREIVFKVRDNELSGRDPFHLMDEEDKNAFFGGLEKKVQQENEKLLNLHEYFHSNIENLDYGADGISLYDPPEKIIPRWKVPPTEINPEFLNNFVEQRKTLFAESLKNPSLSKKTNKDIINKTEKPSSHVTKQSTEGQKGNSASSKTVIQGSDGSIKAGKRSGKEFWQHTKKWSEGFLESYNAESDPEVKAVMRDTGKDLDRWITEKEIKEAADYMDKIPEKGQKFIKEKLEKVKRETELFGPQAVVSKYREYAEDKEEDYLWWLDLPHVLCVELYTVENNEQRVGFYSLEMAADLELNPKQYHVIAFENAGDCKNLCYIIQAHMEMLGNGNAFVVGRPPKEVFREAKANGFSVTVVRKGQLQLNIDQTLEEVEESIVEIGSKIYQDKIDKEHSVNIDGLMKGVFGLGKTSQRKKRSKGKLKS